MKKNLTLTLGSALFVGLASTAHASENPFALQELSSGYQLTQADGTAQQISTPATSKSKDGKCGESKCGQGKCGVKK